MALPQENQEELVRTAMKLAEEAVTGGNLPFAALLIDKSGRVIVTGKNAVNSSK